MQPQCNALSNTLGMAIGQAASREHGTTEGTTHAISPAHGIRASLMHVCDMQDYHPTRCGKLE
eukprot:1106292-Lingulodinium_polyedra.AAC.1